MSKGSGTRSGLLWEVERLLNECEILSVQNPDYGMPSVLVMENVPQVHSAKNKEDWESWLKFLESKGYHNFWKDMNAKNYGVAQSRNRTIMVSIYGEYTYEFPKEIPLTKKMKDYLEPEVDKKYYITSEKARTLVDKLILDGKLSFDEKPDSTRGGVQQNTIDLSIHNPRVIESANCISARTDRGISIRNAEGSGVCETIRIH